MRKLVPLVLLLLCTSVASAQAQLTPAQAREAEWKSYALPQTNFARQMSPEKEFLFRVPADWKQEGTELVFNGPHASFIKVYAYKIPDGYPFQEYFASALQSVRDVPGAADRTLTRKTQLQDLEAREIFLEIDNTEGETIRSTSWITVTGPLAVTFNFQAPVAHAAELEPFFKAVVQSVVFVSRDYQSIEALRSSLIKTSGSGPINETESIVAALGEATTDRESTINRLTSLFSTNADVTIDLLLDRRPLIRAAAVQALARTSNNTLKAFLWKMIDDEELLVAEAAARSVATDPDVVAQTFKHSTSGFNTEAIARVWQFMPRDKRIELLQQIFNTTVTPRKPGLPPPPIKASPKTGVTVNVTELKAVKPGTPVPDPSVGISTDPNVQLGALTLLHTLTPNEFKLPLARLMASNFNPLIAVGLQVAEQRGEALPVDSLFKLVASADHKVSKLAALNLGLSASASDIPRIEALISNNSAAEKKALDDQLKSAIKKIRFRTELSTAKSVAEVREIIGKALTDPMLDEFAWRYDCEATVNGCGPAGSQPVLKTDFTVKPFAENLFPNKVRHYTAIPNPGQSVQRFYETLNGLQMDSPRAQASLVLMIGFLRQQLANELSAPAEAATLIEYTGIDPNSPITMAAWTSDKALDSTSLAQRKAIVLRVKDRARFERAIQSLQSSGNGFTALSDYVAFGTRAIAAFPAILPLSVTAIRSVDPSKPSTGPLLSYAFVGEKEWNGLRVKTIEHCSISSDWQVEHASTHIVFLGDTVILTPDLATIRDLLVHAGNQTDGQHLADNTEYRKAIDRRGDVVYFSDLNTVLTAFGADPKDPGYNIRESGALTVSNASWENSHHLVFEESDWSKPLLPFHPKELTAPRELLPASTIAYYLMKVDLASVWPTKLRTFFIPDDPQNTTKLWALDFKQDVLPELGPECGAVVLELPGLTDFNSVTWAAFCKLKSPKLSEALSGGSLFAGVGPTKDFAEVKAGADSYFVATRKGFLVVSNHDKGLAAFDGKSNLAATRDYSRAVEKVPNSIVAFGGYNLEAAIAAANKIPVEGTQVAFMANMIGSVAGAFHSQNFYATASAGAVEAHSSVAMDREGRYPVADFNLLTRGARITFATLEPAGIPITDQNRLSSLVLKVRSKAPGPIENIRDDVKTAEQTVEQKSAKELVLTIAARRSSPERAIELPVKEPEFAQFLKATTEFAADNEEVKKQAKEIAGTERDAWKVARKLAEWTFKNLEWKHVTSADAAQTLATREADCSEFSALYVAMARSLGLPARMVTGLAYSGKSFGGHAWVEVWIGKWVELDPTWGTDFVDATHIRDSSNALVTSAALNLIELEVLETKRNVADFQKSAKALAQHLSKAIATGARSDVEATIDLPLLTDELMGQGAWSKMNDIEKDKMWSAYRRTVEEIVTGYGSSSPYRKLRLVHLEEKGDVAVATCILAPSDLLLKLRFVRRNELWSLAEVQQSDTALYTISDTLQTTIASIEKVRAGQKPSSSGLSDFARVVVLIETDAAKAITLADKALKATPADKGLRLLKALALFLVEKYDDAVKILRELSNEDYAPAIYKLADELSDAENEATQKESVKLWERYTSLEPHDPRGFRNLGVAYSALENKVQTEAAYRKALELSPADDTNYFYLVYFLAMNDRVAEVKPLLVAYDQHKDTDEDVFVMTIQRLYFASEPAAAEKLAASEPARVKNSSEANLILGRIQLDAGR
ncbi:MAG TPA: transglutaminase domain-containing protein, partial [Pyrinomonadaceae bacterium]|nr:transglutaminase domain-containing protein [Pyrinomonadaceae bacterium]